MEKDKKTVINALILNFSCVIHLNCNPKTVPPGSQILIQQYFQCLEFIISSPKNFPPKSGASSDDSWPRTAPCSLQTTHLHEESLCGSTAGLFPSLWVSQLHTHGQSTSLHLHICIKFKCHSKCFPTSIKRKKGRGKKEEQLIRFKTSLNIYWGSNLTCPKSAYYDWLPKLSVVRTICLESCLQTGHTKSITSPPEKTTVWYHQAVGTKPGLVNASTLTGINSAFYFSLTEFASHTKYTDTTNAICC